MPDDAWTLFLCGDVMLGRGVDQILPYPGDPALYERMVSDARTYVDLAVRANGEIPQPVDWSWPWGDAPVMTIASPLGSMRTSALSYGPSPPRRTYGARPIPT